MNNVQRVKQYLDEKYQILREEEKKEVSEATRIRFDKSDDFSEIKPDLIKALKKIKDAESQGKIQYVVVKKKSTPRTAAALEIEFEDGQYYVTLVQVGKLVQFGKEHKNLKTPEDVAKAIESVWDSPMMNDTGK